MSYLDSDIILITGATGFIGSNLVRAIVSDKKNVHIIVRPSSNLWRLKDILPSLSVHECDIVDHKNIRNLIEEIKPTHVFHAVHYGGNSGQNDNKKIRETVIEGTASLYGACKNIDSIKSIVNVGSSSEYGFKTVAMKESMLLEPNSEYGVAKAWTTMYGQHFSREFKLPVITARLFSVYGPYEHRKRFMSEVILSCLEQKDPTLTNPVTVRDFVFIDDVVKALFLISQKGKGGEIYNVGTGEEVSLLESANLIAKYTGFEKSLKWGTMGDRSFDSGHWKADVSHIKDSLGWKHEVDIESGIKKTVEWFKVNKDLYEDF